MSAGYQKTSDGGVVPARVESRPGPGRVAWCGALLVAASAAALSFTALAALARACGVVPAIDWMLPLAIDAGVLVAAKFWLSPGLPERAAHFARVLTLLLILVSCAGNVSAHWLGADAPAPFLLTALVSLIPPLTLAGVAHLLVLTRTGQTAAAPTESVLPVAPAALLADPEPAAPDTAAAAQIPAKALLLPDPGQGAPAAADDLSEQLSAWIAAAGEVPSKRRVMERFSIGNARASRLLAALPPQTNGHTRPELVRVK